MGQKKPVPQADGAPEPAGHMKPAGHGNGCPVPEGQKEPAGQLAQVDAPYVLLYVPAGHSVQLVAAIGADVVAVVV